MPDYLYKIPAIRYKGIMPINDHENLPVYAPSDVSSALGCETEDVVEVLTVLVLLEVKVADDVKVKGVAVGLQGTVVAVVLVMVTIAMLEVDSVDSNALGEDSS